MPHKVSIYIYNPPLTSSTCNALWSIHVHTSVRWSTKYWVETTAAAQSNEKKKCVDIIRWPKLSCDQLSTIFLARCSSARSFPMCFVRFFSDDYAICDTRAPCKRERRMVKYAYSPVDKTINCRLRITAKCMSLNAHQSEYTSPLNTSIECAI